MRRLVLTLAFASLAASAVAAETTGPCGEQLTAKQLAIYAPGDVQKPKIVERPAFRLTGADGEFTVETSVIDIDRLWGTYKTNKAWIRNKSGTGTIGVCYGGTGGAFRYLGGIEVSGDTPAPKYLTSIDVPAARYAVFEHRGRAFGVAMTRKAIHDTYLAAAGLTALPGPELEVYPEHYQANSTKSVMEIWVPVAP